MWFIYSLYFAIWTSISFLLLKTLTKRINILLILFLNSLFTIPVTFLLLQLQGGIPKVTPDFYKFLAISGSLDAVAAISLMLAIKKAPVSLISPIESFNPVFTTILASFFINEIPSPIKFIAILIIVCGSYLLNFNNINEGILTPFKKLLSNTGVRLAFLTTFIWSITPIFQKQAIFQTSPTSPLFAIFVNFSIASLVLLPFQLNKLTEIKNLTKQDFLKFLAIGIFGALAGYAGFAAYSQTNVGYATAIFKLSTISTVFWGGIIFKESGIKMKLIAASIMLLGTILLVS